LLIFLADQRSLFLQLPTRRSDFRKSFTAFHSLLPILLHQNRCALPHHHHGRRRNGASAVPKPRSLPFPTFFAPDTLAPLSVLRSIIRPVIQTHPQHPQPPPQTPPPNHPKLQLSSKTRTKATHCLPLFSPPPSPFRRSKLLLKNEMKDLRNTRLLFYDHCLHS